MNGKFSNWCRQKAPVLFEKEMPIWLTIVVSLLAAGGAYWISPIINREFQVDAARSAHIAKTTDNLNVEIIELSTKVRRLNESLVNGSADVPTLRGDCLDLLTKLQWMLGFERSSGKAR